MSNQSATIAPSRGWRIYAWVMAALLLLALVLTVFEGSGSIIIDAIDYGVSALSLVGVFGYAYGRAIATRAFWRVLLPVLIAWDSGMLIRQYLDPETGSDLLIFSVIVVLVASLLVPSYIAVFRYGYRSPALWTSRI